MRKLLFQIHLWTGLILFAPLVLIGLSGSILVYKNELGAMFAPKAEIVASGGQARSYDEIAAAALKEAGGKGMKVTAFTAPEKATDPAEVRIGRGARGGETVKVDPATLEVLGKEGGGGRGAGEKFDLFRFLHDVHGRLLVEGPGGRQLVGWMGVAMCILGISGIVIWWPKKGGLKRAVTFATKGPPYRINRDFHGAMGIWILAVFMIVSATGVYISFPEPMAKATVSVMPGRDLRSSQQKIKVEPIENAEKITLTAAADLATKAVPDARLISIAPALDDDAPVRVMMAHPGYEDRAPATNVFIDPYRNSVIEVRDPRQYTSGETFQAWQRPLHEGSGLGGIWKFVVFLSGIAPLGFAITGVLMWLIKRKARAPMNEPNAEPVREDA
jgi:uncharacterized iron-regulated membrane protein